MKPVVRLAGILLNLSVCMAQAPAPEPVVVGSLDGAPVLIREPSQADMSARFFLERGRAATPSDAAELKHAREGLTCARIRNSLERIGFDRALTELNVSVSEEDLANAREKRLKLVNPEVEANRIREYAVAVGAALSEVYDSGADPTGVFRDRLAPLGIAETVWAFHLRQAASPAYRAQVARGALITAADITKAALDARGAAQKEKLDAAIDDQIGSSDPTFRIYAAELRKSLAEGTAILVAHREYVEAKRTEWWRKRATSMVLVLNDHSLAGRCGLGDMGFVLR